MKIKQFQVDAFTSKVFGGNPAAVCLLDEWLPDSVLQHIGAENNLSETAYLVRTDSDVDNHFHIRWFTPTSEVRLCGHATLASAHVLFAEVGLGSESLVLDSLSGELMVGREGDFYVLNFPQRPVAPCQAPEALLRGLKARPVEVLGGVDYLLVLENEEAVRSLQPEIELFHGLDREGVIVTAQGKDHDVVSRFFAPNLGISEDPVTGAAHCAVAPFWAKKLGVSDLRCYQASARGGQMHCSLQGDRVVLKGQAVTFMRGEIEV